MNDSEVNALDHDLDALAQRDQPGRTGADRDDVLELLARIPAVHWPDRDAGERVAKAVAARLGAERADDAIPAAAAMAHPNGQIGLKIFDTNGAGPPSRSFADDAARVRYRGRGRHLGPRRLARGRSVAAVSAAAVVVGAALTAVATHGGALDLNHFTGPPQVYHSRFAAAVLPGYSTVAPKGGKLAGGWQLLSYLSTPGWHANDIGTPPDGLSCPTTTVCYMTAARPVPASGPGYLTASYYNLLEVSRDGGVSWTTLSLPSDVSVTTPLQCPVSATTCYAAGYDASRIVLLATSDGGHSWSARPVPGPVSFADALACTTHDGCVGLFVEKGWAPGYHLSAQNAEVLVTRNGGLTWAAGPPVPHGQLPDYLACGGTTCVVFDQLITQDNSKSVNGDGRLTIAPGSWSAWFSHDGGATWRRGHHPGSLWTMASNDLPEAGTISCSDHLHCWAAMSNEIGEPGIATTFAATRDGGATWVTQSLPVQRARQFIPLAMSCPTTLQCYAAGGDSAGPVILTTRNGGKIWTPVNLPKTSSGSHHKIGIEPTIGLIACAAAGQCVAAPDDSQSAHMVPIYSLGAGLGHG